MEATPIAESDASSSSPSMVAAYVQTCAARAAESEPRQSYIEGGGNHLRFCIHPDRKGKPVILLV